MSIVKSHRYPVSVRWKEGRLTELSATGKPRLVVATPPEFKGGIAGIWSPEDLLVGSLASCYAVTLVAVAERAGITLAALRVDGTGHVERLNDGRFGFVSIEVDAHVEVGADEVDAAELAASRAKDICLVSIALDTPVRFEVDVVTDTAPVVTQT
jgi:organic hydroperoxide reductase OsmC/OhrA